MTVVPADPRIRTYWDGPVCAFDSSNLEKTLDTIEAEQPDILIDMSLSPPLFDRRVAPRQAHWIASTVTMGGRFADGFIADDYTIPEEHAGDYHEEIIRMPVWAPYEVPGYADAHRVTTPPFLKNGYVTFSVCNRHLKMDLSAIDAWCEILRRVPDSRLCLKARAHGPDGVRASTQRFCCARYR